MASDIMMTPDVSTGDPQVADELGDYIPEGFDTVHDFLTQMREEFTADTGYDRQNRLAALDDLKFIAGDQWDPEVLAQREGRPCLTINVLPQFIGQVVGDRRINKTSIKVSPKKGATKEQAEIRSGLIKSIEAYSRAERVYDTLCENQVSCGIGNFRVDLDYADNDVFEQDIFIRSIPNPLAVIWDRMSIDITGRDASHCFVQDTMPRKVYEARWPEMPAPSELGDDTTNTLMASGWFDRDVVRIVEYWRLVRKQRKLALMMDGDVKDVTDLPQQEWEGQLWIDPRTQKPRIRVADRTYANMHLVTGFAILSEAYEVPLTRLPIIRAEGRIVQVGEDRVRYSLIRWAKDSQRLKNYWRSLSAETLALAPKAVWLAPDDAVEGREDDFRDGHDSNDPLLIYNKNASAPPQRVPPPMLNAAALQESDRNQQDIKDTTGLQDASLGVRSNEISGRAIKARQVEGDVATVIYHDNVNEAILEGGDVVNQLLGIAYDSVRTVRVIGADDKDKMLVINDPDDETSPDITSGKYDVAIVTGPSYTTQRQEAAEAMMNAIQVFPQLMGIAGDLVVEAQDWPGATRISERLANTIDPQFLTEDERAERQKPPSPEQQAAEQQAAAAQQMQMEQAAAAMAHEQQMRDLEIAIKEAEATDKAETARAKALQNEQDELMGPSQLALAEAKAQEAEYNAMRAEHEAARAEFEAINAPVEAEHRRSLAGRTTPAKSDSSNRGAGPRPGGDRSSKGRTK